jgi:TrmH family RNA methyltransferase
LDPMKEITSLQNPLIKNILLLEEKPRERNRQNLTVVEGVREVRVALSEGYTITTLVICPAFLEDPEIRSLVHREISSFETVAVSPEVFNRLAYRKDMGGVIALAVMKRMLLHDIHLSSRPLLLVLESMEKPGNLGAVLRTADAASLDAVIICDPQTDVYNPNAIRSSLGCIFSVPVVTSTTEYTIAWLRSNGIRTFGTALTATRQYHLSDFRVPSALIMGSEASGLSQAWLDEADELIKIPMLGKVDSMNVSASAAIVVYEALRQRGFTYTSHAPDGGL